MQVEVAIAGVMLLLMLSGWCAIACTKSLIQMFRTGRTYDRQLGVVHEDDNRSMFGLHATGLILLIVVCIFVQVSLILTTIQHLLGQQ